MRSFLNGWDYIVAIEQKQINTGLKQLYNDGKLLHNCNVELDTFFGKATLKCDIGEPNITAIKDGLKICQLSMKVSNVRINDRVIDSFNLNIQAALTCIETYIRNTEDKHYEVFIDFKDENAVYNIILNSSAGNKDIQLFETVLKQEFQMLNKNEYKVTEFTLKQDKLNEFIPQLVDFSFVLNTQKVDRSPFLLCCSLNDKGPQIENRLVFTSDILTANNPSCFWFSHRLIFKLISEELEKQLKKINKNIKLICNEYNIQLSEKVKIIKVLPNTVYLNSVHVYSQDNKIFIDIGVLIDGLAKLTAPIILDFKQVDNQLKVNIKILNSKTESILSKAEKIIVGVFTVGISEGVIAIIKDVVGDMVNEEFKSKIENRLEGISDVIKELMQIQDKKFSGHPDIHNAFINGDGDVCGEINAIVKK